MKSKRSQEGYLLIDNRAGARAPATPGTPEIAAGATFESATITCSHCHAIVVLNPDRSRDRHYCRRCDHYICDQCAVGGDCTPLTAVFDALQAQAEQQTRAWEPSIVLTDK